jgi:5-(carboxyamino)imidazole ribonucleotide mutase
MATVGIVIGSKTDEPLIKPATDILKQLGLSYELSIISAHRKPDKVREYGLSARERGFEIIIAAAGGSAHLPGVIASWSDLPVIGVPLPTSEMKGVDSLYSIVQMPTGVPVACVGIGESGVKNAALLAGRILSLKYSEVAAAYQNYINSVVKA